MKYKFTAHIFFFLIIRLIVMLNPDTVTPSETNPEIWTASLGLSENPKYADIPNFIIPHDQVILYSEDEIDTRIKETIDRSVDTIINYADQLDYEDILALSSQNEKLTHEMLENIFTFTMESVVVSKDSEYIIETHGENEVYSSTYNPTYFVDYELNDSGIYYIRHTMVEHNKNSDIWTLIFKKVNDTYVLEDMAISHYKIHGKTYEDWMDDSRNSLDEGYVYPAFMKLNIARSCFPPFTHPNQNLRQEEMALLNKIINASKVSSYPYFSEEEPYYYDLGLVVESLNVKVITISLEYWIDEENLGYVIHYDSDKSPTVKGRGLLPETKEEIQMLHDYLTSNKILDLADHYTYVPYLNESHYRDGEYKLDEVIVID